MEGERIVAQKEVVRIGAYKEFIASGVRSGDLLTLSGQVSVDAEGKVIGEGDIEAQFRQVYVNIKEVLDAFGATMDSIVDEMWLVTDIQDVLKHSRTIWPIRAEAYGKDPEVTQTLVQVAALVMPELLVEIKCVARV